MHDPAHGENPPSDGTPWRMGGTPGVGDHSSIMATCTVSASILPSFDFARAAFTPPARPSLMRPAAAERLASAPSGAAPHRRVEGLVDFCD
eukprot:5884204-Prymnesium_polylepis.1